MLCCTYIHTHTHTCVYNNNTLLLEKPGETMEETIPSFDDHITVSEELKRVGNYPKGRLLVRYKRVRRSKQDLGW